MMAHVMAILAGKRLGLPQGIDFPDSLIELDTKALLCLLQLILCEFLDGIVQQKHQIRSTSNERHKFHYHRITAGKQIRVYAGHIIKNVINHRNRTKLTLGLGRITG